MGPPRPHGPRAAPGGPRPVAPIGVRRQMTLRPLADLSAADWFVDDAGIAQRCAPTSDRRASSRTSGCCTARWVPATTATKVTSRSSLLRALCDVLARHTTTPDDCFFGSVGRLRRLYGGESAGFLTAFSGPDALARPDLHQGEAAAARPAGVSPRRPRRAAWSTFLATTTSCSAGPSADAGRVGRGELRARSPARHQQPQPDVAGRPRLVRHDQHRRARWTGSAAPRR